MLGVALIDIRVWLRYAYAIYVVAFAAAGRRRRSPARSAWARSAGSISASIQLQPSEIMKIALVLALARYFHGLTLEDVGQPLLPDRAGRC